MNKSSPLNNISFDEDWSSHPIIEWLSNHKRILLYFFFGFLAALILASRLITWRTLDAEKDFFQANTLFTQFEKTIDSADQSAASSDLEQLQAIMQRHPELKPKYEGSLAQTLLVTGQIPQAQTFINDIFQRTKPDHLQLYQRYTETSVLVGQTKYAEALQNAKQLKSELDQMGKETNAILYVFNLIRLAMLHQHMQQPQEELDMWEELQSYPSYSDAMLAIHPVLQIGNASLNQYIEERKNNLKH